MEEITKLAQELDEKQSWIKKGFYELLAKLNERLEGYKPTTTYTQIEYKIREWENENGSKRRVTIDLDVDGDGVQVVVRFGKQDDYEGKWDWETLEKPSLTTVRLIAQKLPEILQHFATRLKEENNSEQATVDALKNMLAMLEGGSNGN